MNDLMTRIAEVDPDFARSLRRNQILSYVFAAVALAAIVGTAYAVLVNFDQGNEITQVQHSACQAEPAGHECQKSKAESSRAANIATTCIPFWKAGYPCPKPGSTAAERQTQRGELQANSKSIQDLEQGSSGGGGLTSTGAGTGGGTGGTKRPPKSQVPPTQAGPSPPPVETPTSAHSEQQASGGGASDHPGLIGSTVNDVAGSVVGAGQLVCGLAEELALICP
jgi:hypothetical protein